MMAALLHTDGNGEILERVFSSLSQILYGNEEGIKGTFRLLVRLSLTVGAFSALCVAFLRQKFEPLIKSFFLPGLAIIALLLAPRTLLEIRDHAEEGRVRKVENVPWFLATSAGWASELFYRVRVLFEGSLKAHYPWTRQIQEGASPFSLGPLPFSDPHLETNLRGFCRECVAHDLGLGLYSPEELSRAPDLFSFLKQKTARNRTVFYQGTWIPCKEAIEKIEANVTGEVLVHALVNGDLWAQERSVRQLLKEGGEEKQWIKQQIAIQILKEELAKTKRGVKGTWQSLPASSILSLRNFSEALLYLIFPMVLLLAILSFGLKLILEWLRLLVWISLWPILYVAVDLFLQSLWESRLPQTGLALATQEELLSLYGSMELTAALLIAAIPVFTWALLKGGAQITASFVKTEPEIKLQSDRKEGIEISQTAPIVQEVAPKQAFEANAPFMLPAELKSEAPSVQQEGAVLPSPSPSPVLRRKSEPSLPVVAFVQEKAPGMPMMERPPEKEIVNMHTPLKEEG